MSARKKSPAKRRSRTRLFAIRGTSGRIRLVHGDCIRGMKRLDAKSVDVVVTSPPYNAGKDYSTYDDTLPRDKYLAWTHTWAEAVSRVLSDEGSLFLNVGARPSDPWIAFDVLGCFRELFALQNVIHWVKSIAIDPDELPAGLSADEALTFGHYQPIKSTRYLNAAHEYIFHLTHAGQVELDRLAVGVPYSDKSNVTRWAAARADVRCRGNTWFIPYKTIQSRDKERPHPATFPEKLPEMCLKLHGVPRIRLAMDPFLGLGSTAAACVRLKVPFVGFDIDAQYVKESAKRVKDALKAGR